LGLKKPSGRKPRQQKQKRSRKAAASASVHVPVVSAPHPRSEAPRLQRFSAFYEGLMGTPPLRVTKMHGGRADARTLSDGEDSRRDFMMLSLPILAMMMVGMVTQALKTERRGAEFGMPFPTVLAPVAPTFGVGQGVGQGNDRVAIAPSRALPPFLVAPPVDVVSPVAPVKQIPSVAAVAVPAGEASVVVGLAPALVAGAHPLPVSVGSVPPLASVNATEGERQMALLAPVAPPAVIARPDVVEPSIVPSQEVAEASPPAVGAGEQCAAPVGLLAGRGMRKGILATPVPASLSREAYGLALATAAREQLSGLTIYNDKYRRIAYPMGDVQTLYGVCTDVIIRAYRGVGVDLQQRVHEAGMSGGDASIGHRRTETLRRFLAQHGASLPISSVAEDYQPGDIVTYYRPQNRHSRSHIAMVSDVVAPSGRFMILHNRGWGPQLEDGLFVDQMTGHYRYRPFDPARGIAAAAMAEKSSTVALTKVSSRAKSKSVAARVRKVDGAATVGLGR
jgi:uncharacterized protein YijF (DUF1287 family)